MSTNVKHSSSKKTGGAVSDATSKQLQFIEKSVLNPVMKHPKAFPFLVPVNAVALRIPDYHDIIRKPMDLGTIQGKLKKKLYRDVTSCISDFELTFANCYKFNNSTDEVVRMCKTIESLFRKKVALMPGEIAVKRKYNRKSSETKTRPVTNTQPPASTSVPIKSHRARCLSTSESESSEADETPSKATLELEQQLLAVQAKIEKFAQDEIAKSKLKDNSMQRGSIILQQQEAATNHTQQLSAKTAKHDSKKESMSSVNHHAAPNKPHQDTKKISSGKVRKSSAALGRPPSQPAVCPITNQPQQSSAARAKHDSKKELQQQMAVSTQPQQLSAATAKHESNKEIQMLSSAHHYVAPNKPNQHTPMFALMHSSVPTPTHDVLNSKSNKHIGEKKSSGEKVRKVSAALDRLPLQTAICDGGNCDDIEGLRTISITNRKRSSSSAETKTQPPASTSVPTQSHRERCLSTSDSESESSDEDEMHSKAILELEQQMLAVLAKFNKIAQVKITKPKLKNKSLMSESIILRQQETATYHKQQLSAHTAKHDSKKESLLSVHHAAPNKPHQDTKKSSSGKVRKVSAALGRPPVQPAVCPNTNQAQQPSTSRSGHDSNKELQQQEAVSNQTQQLSAATAKHDSKKELQQKESVANQAQQPSTSRSKHDAKRELQQQEAVTNQTHQLSAATAKKELQQQEAVSNQTQQLSAATAKHDSNKEIQMLSSAHHYVAPIKSNQHTPMFALVPSSVPTPTHDVLNSKSHKDIGEKKSSSDKVRKVSATLVRLPLQTVVCDSVNCDDIGGLRTFSITNHKRSSSSVAGAENISERPIKRQKVKSKEHVVDEDRSSGLELANLQLCMSSVDKPMTSAHFSGCTEQQDEILTGSQSTDVTMAELNTLEPSPTVMSGNLPLLTLAETLPTHRETDLNISKSESDETNEQDEMTAREIEELEHQRLLIMAQIEMLDEEEIEKQERKNRSPHCESTSLQQQEAVTNGRAEQQVVSLTGIQSTDVNMSTINPLQPSPTVKSGCPPSLMTEVNLPTQRETDQNNSNPAYESCEANEQDETTAREIEELEQQRLLIMAQIAMLDEEEIEKPERRDKSPLCESPSLLQQEAVTNHTLQSSAATAKSDSSNEMLSSVDHPAASYKSNKSTPDFALVPSSLPTLTSEVLKSTSHMEIIQKISHKTSDGHLTSDSRTSFSSVAAVENISERPRKRRKVHTFKSKEFVDDSDHSSDLELDSQQRLSSVAKPIITAHLIDEQQVEILAVSQRTDVTMASKNPLPLSQRCKSDSPPSLTTTAKPATVAVDTPKPPSRIKSMSAARQEGFKSSTSDQLNISLILSQMKPQYPLLASLNTAAFSGQTSSLPMQSSSSDSSSRMNGIGATQSQGNPLTPGVLSAKGLQKPSTSQESLGIKPSITTSKLNSTIKNVNSWSNIAVAGATTKSDSVGDSSATAILARKHYETYKKKAQEKAERDRERAEFNEKRCLEREASEILKQEQERLIAEKAERAEQERISREEQERQRIIEGRENRKQRAREERQRVAGALRLDMNAQHEIMAQFEAEH